MVKKNKNLLFLRRNKSVIITVIFLAIIADIVFVKESSDLTMFTMLGFYIATILFYRLKSRSTFLLGLSLLGVMYLEFIISGTSVATEKAAVWLFLFLLVGIIQQLRE